MPLFCFACNPRFTLRTTSCTQLPSDWRPKALPANISSDAPSQKQQKGQDWSGESTPRDSSHRPTLTGRTGDHHGYERIGKSLSPQGLRGLGLLLCRQSSSRIDRILTNNDKAWLPSIMPSPARLSRARAPRAYAHSAQVRTYTGSRSLHKEIYL